MKKIELSQGVIDILRQLDTRYIQIEQEAQEAINQLQEISNQKSMILKVIRLEKNIDPSLKLKLNEAYNLEEITDEEYNNLTTTEDTMKNDIIE